MYVKPNYETNKEIPTLSEVRKQEALEKEKEKNKLGKKVLSDAISFYQKNYPKSKCENIYTKPKKFIKINEKHDLEEILNNDLNEEDLWHAVDVLDYFHDERQLRIIKEHDAYKRLRAMILKTVPGGIFQSKLDKLKTQKKEIEKKIEEIEKKIKQEKEQFYKDRNITIVEELKCQYCGRTFGNKGGLIVHEKSCKHKQIKNEKETKIS